MSITPSLLSSRRLQAIEQERSPQVLAIQHGDEEEGREDQSEDDDSAGVGTGSTDEEEERDEDSSDTGSPDSPVDSPSPGEFALQTHSLLFSNEIQPESMSATHLFFFALFCFSELLHKGVPLPDIASRSGSPNVFLGPSPPLIASATAGYHKLPGIRARRLQRCNANRRLLPVSGCEPDTLRAEKAPGDPDMTTKPVQQLAHMPRPPPLINQAKGQMDPR